MQRPTAIGALLSLGLIGLACACLAGCEDRQRAVDQEAVARALDALRDAPARDLPRRRGLLRALEATPAQDPDAVRARDTCAAAYRPLLDGTEAEEGVKAELDKEDPSPTLIARLLDAEAKIKQSATIMPDCERASLALRAPARAP
ncbi:MAG: hypothetical protein U0359_23655 [Byssovorax sp.]